MNLSTAIKHAKEVSCTCTNNACAKDHGQLANWLKELRQLRKEKRAYIKLQQTVCTLENVIESYIEDAAGEDW